MYQVQPWKGKGVAKCIGGCVWVRQEGDTARGREEDTDD